MTNRQRLEAARARLGGAKPLLTGTMSTTPAEKLLQEVDALDVNLEYVRDMERVILTGTDLPPAEKPPQKAKKKPWQPPQNPEQVHGRLPQGSRFNAVYDAKRVEWVTVLTIPLGPNEAEAAGCVKDPDAELRLFDGECCVEFRTKKGGLMRTFMRLDEKYRIWKKQLADLETAE